MRISLFAVAAGLLLASHAVPSVAQRADRDISPLSLALQADGTKAQQRGDLDAATGYFESALVADPRNRSAYIALAQIALAQGLAGKAVGLYREALTIDPQDSAALVGQGLALVERGAVDRARDNLAEAKRFCADPCVAAEPLIAALAKLDKTAELSPDAVKPRPVASVAVPDARN